MEDFYVKRDGEFIPAGLLFYKDCLYDGIWAVQHTKFGRRITNLSYIDTLIKAGDVIPLRKKVKLFQCAENIAMSSEFNEFLKESHSILEIVTYIVGKAYEKNQ